MPLTTNSVTDSRIKIFAERAKARGDERSMESWLEELVGFAITELSRRWVSSDKYHNRQSFVKDLANLGVIGADGAIKNGDLLAKLVAKYKIVPGTQKEV